MRTIIINFQDFDYLINHHNRFYVCVIFESQSIIFLWALYYPLLWFCHGSSCMMYVIYVICVIYVVYVIYIVCICYVTNGH